jgi:hypothetical protein
MALYRYRLIDTEGNDLGPFVSRDSDIQAGRTIPRGAGEAWHVTAVVAAEQAEQDVNNFRAYLVVVADALA